MKTIIFSTILIFIVSFSKVTAQDDLQNTNNDKWGYYLQITDTNYIPVITGKDEQGYITLHTGITDYDAVFAKYKITEFFPFAPTAATELLRQIYVVICDSGQTQLGLELKENYSHVIPMVDYYYHNPIPTEVLMSNYSEKSGQRGSILWLGENNGLKRKVYFFNINGKTIYTTQTPENYIDPSLSLSKGISVYKIETEGGSKCGIYYNF
jgi:hypothetical protein